MWRNKAKSFTLIELLVSMSILAVLILASIPMLTSNKDKQFSSDVQAVTVFIEKAKSFSLNPNIDNAEDTLYRVKRSGGSFSIVGVRQSGGVETETLVSDQTLSISGSGYTFCSVGTNSIDFVVGTGSVTADSQIGIRNGSMQAGIEITPDGQIKTLRNSPC